MIHEDHWRILPSSPVAGRCRFDKGGLAEPAPTVGSTRTYAPIYHLLRLQDGAGRRRKYPAMAGNGLTMLCLATRINT